MAVAISPGAELPVEVGRQHFIRIALWVMLVLVLFVGLAPTVAPRGPWPWDPPMNLVVGATALFYGIAYWRNEQGHAHSAARWLIAGVLVGSLAVVVVPGTFTEPRSYAYIAYNVLIAAFVLSWRGAAVMAIVDGVALGWLAWTIPGYTAAYLTEDMLLVAVLAGLSMTFAAYSERNHRAERVASQALDQTVSDMRAMLDNSPDGILTVRQNGDLLRINEVAKRWLRREAGREISPGDNLVELVPPQHWVRIEPVLADAVRLGAASSEVTFSTSQGPRWFQIHLRRIDGTDDSYAVQVRDTTQGQQAQLAERAAFRDRVELQKLREIDRFRTRLLNMASHEMRTPMTPLRLQLGVLEHRMQSLMDDRTRHSFDTIKRNVARLTMLLDDLLDVAKLEADELRLRPQPIDVDRLVGGECEVYRNMARSKELRLHISSRVGAQVQADAHRIAQVFSNLLSNALKYARTEVRVTAWREGDEAVVEVADDGVGFDPHRKDGLWEPFVQVHDGDDQLDGTGLGLYICRGIIEHHGGRIWAESPGPNRGARFCFSLPLHTSLKYEGQPMVVHE